MKLEKWAQLGEIIGSFAIVVTLIILVVELRANTDAIRSQTAQDTFNLSFQASTYMTEEEALAYDRLSRVSLHTLDEREHTLASYAARAIFTTYDNHYYQYQRGNLDEEVHQTYRRRLINVLSGPGKREWWNENRDLFTESFQSYVAELLADIDG